MFATRSVTVLVVITFNVVIKSSSTTSTASPNTTEQSPNSTTEVSPNSSSQTSAPSTTAISNFTLDTSTSASPTTTTNTTFSKSTTTETPTTVTEIYLHNSTTTTNGNADNVTLSEMTSTSSKALHLSPSPPKQLSTGITPTSSGKSTTPVTNPTNITGKSHSTVLPAGSTRTTETIFVTTTTTGSTMPQEQTPESQVTLPTQQKSTTTRYATFYLVNGSCPRGYIIRNNMCVYLCENKVCQNGGVCAVVSDNAGSEPVALCRCKIEDDIEYSGDNCETSKISHVKERKITLGVLIPLVCILLSALMCTCLKLKRHGNSSQAMRDKYDINSGAL